MADFLVAEDAGDVVQGGGAGDPGADDFGAVVVEDRLGPLGPACAHLLEVLDDGDELDALPCACGG